MNYGQLIELSIVLFFFVVADNGKIREDDEMRMMFRNDLRVAAKQSKLSISGANF